MSTHLAEIVTAGEDDGREEDVEHDGVSEREHLLHRLSWSYTECGANDHAWYQKNGEKEMEK